jgi:zinc-binding dehydrogenase
MDGPFGVVLRSPVLSSIWYGRRIYRGAGGSSCAATRGRLDGTRRLPWYTGRHGSPSRSCCRCREWTHCFGARSGGFSAPLRRSVGTFRGSPSDRNREVAADEATAKNAGAHEVLVSDKELTSRVKALASDGIDHIVEVAFGANIEADVELLKLGGSIASYATDNAAPKIPFWQMVFKNIRIFFTGSDDFPKEAKLQAARDLNAALEAGWAGFKIGERIPLADIARAHELVEHPVRPGRVVVVL